MLPSDDELEVTLLGPGVGESICLHVGNGAWIVVDSCRDPLTKGSAPLAYLQSLGVDVATQVRLIVGTHCDQDHTVGLAELVRLAAVAEVALPMAFTERAFRDLVDASNRLSGTSELKSFGDVLAVLHAQNRIPRRLQADVSLRLSAACAITAITPSPAEVEASMQWVADQSRQIDQRLAVVPLTPNETSVGLHVAVDNREILLGADIENHRSPDRGWSAVLVAQAHRIGSVGILKIPHHGSPGAHNPDVWDRWIHPDAVTCVAPFNRGRRPLPQMEDVQRICGLRRRSFACALPLNDEFERYYGPSLARIAEHFGAAPRRLISRRPIGRVTARWARGEQIQDIKIHWSPSAHGKLCRDP